MGILIWVNIAWWHQAINWTSIKPLINWTSIKPLTEPVEGTSKKYGPLTIEIELKKWPLQAAHPNRFHMASANVNVTVINTNKI